MKKFPSRRIRPGGEGEGEGGGGDGGYGGSDDSATIYKSRMRRNINLY